MSLNQFDLYAQKIFREITALANGELTTLRTLKAFLRTHFCPEPFRTIETGSDGLIYMCCPAWLPVPVGEIQRKTWTDLARFDRKGNERINY